MNAPHSLTVLFEPTSETMASLYKRVNQVVHALVKKGTARNLEIEALSDDEYDDERAFLITFSGETRLVKRALEAIPGVNSAYAPPARDVMGVAHAR